MNDPTKREADLLIKQLIEVCESIRDRPPDAVVTSREVTLTTAFLLIDRYMRHGHNLPTRWIERRAKCHAVVHPGRSAHVLDARCALEKGHGGRCEP